MFFDPTGEMLEARKNQIAQKFGTTVLPEGQNLTQRQSQENHIRSLQGRPPRYAHEVRKTTRFTFVENGQRLPQPRVEHTYGAPKGVIALIPA